MICIYKKIHYLTFDLDLWVKVTRNAAQYPLLHVTFLEAQFEVAPSNGLCGDIFTRNVMDARTHRRTDRQTDEQWTNLGSELIYLFF